MALDIGQLHHVGHLVRDIGEGLALYERLGFALPPPSFPGLSPSPGAPPRACGVGNTHADFDQNFVELATYASADRPDRVPDGATLVPLLAPPEQLPRVAAMLERASGTIASCLERFEGLHILVFETPDAEAAARRLRAAGVPHGGAFSVQRRVETARGPRMERIGVVEIDDDAPGAAGTGRVPEGRIALAENPPDEVMRARRLGEHPNGAVALVESVLCVAAAELDAVEQRYSRYLARTARREGPARVFDLEGGRLVLVADEALETVLPGERARALPAFVGYAVAVRDLGATRRLLDERGVATVPEPSGGVFVPSAVAMGAAVIFRGA